MYSSEGLEFLGVASETINIDLGFRCNLVIGFDEEVRFEREFWYVKLIDQALTDDR